MENQVLPDDFKEFLKLLNEAEVEYLLIGGYAVGYHGYPRATADMDILVAISSVNASKLVHVFGKFGMKDPSVSVDLFQERGLLRAVQMQRKWLKIICKQLFHGDMQISDLECFLIDRKYVATYDSSSSNHI